MKLVLSILTAIILLSTSIYYINQYKSNVDQEDQLQAYEKNLVYNKETGKIKWDLVKQELDDYQMQAIQKTMKRKFIQKYIESDYITHLDIDISQATNVSSIRPILEGITTGFDLNLVHLTLNFSHLKIDINKDFENWQLPSQIQTLAITLDHTQTQSIRNILLSMRSIYSQLKDLKLSTKKLDSDIILDQSFADITLPQLNSFELQSQTTKEQDNFDNLAKTLSPMNLTSLKLNFSYSKFKQVDSSLQILANSQRYLKTLLINFYYNNSSIYTSRKSQFSESMIRLFRRNNLQTLNLNVSGIKIDKLFLSSLEDYLYDVSSNDIKVILNFQLADTSKVQAVEIFQDVKTIMGDKLSITYPY